MFGEEILVRMGLDSTALNGGLKGAKDNVRDFTEGTLGGLKSIKASLKTVKLAMIGMVLVDKLDGLMDKAKDIGEFWGTFSTGGLKAIDMMNVVKAKAVQAATEMRDAAKALIMGDAAKKDYKKVKRDDQFDAIDGYDDKRHFLESEMLQIGKEREKIEEKKLPLEQRLQDLQKTGRHLEASDVKKLQELRSQIAQNDLETAKKESEIHKLDREHQKDSKEESTKKSKEEAHIAFEAYQRFKSARDSLSERKSKSLDEGTKLSLDELANMNPRQFRKGSDAREDIFDAREVQDLEGKAKDIGYSQEDRQGFYNQAQELKKGIVNLKASEKNPFAELDKNAKATADVLTSFAKDGVPIRED